MQKNFLSPELAAGYPRGVTPRGDTYVAKIGTVNGYDYLGSFPTAEEAEEAYIQSSAIYNRLGSECETTLAARTTSKKIKFSASHRRTISPEMSETVEQTNEGFSMALTKHLKTPYSISPPVTSLFAAITLWLVDEAVPAQAQRMADFVQDCDAVNKQTMNEARVETEIILDSKKKQKNTKEKRISLYNRVVTVDKQPPCYPYKYWFVYQYVPDMEWCHLCPIHETGIFKQGVRKGRRRFKLVPEGCAREIDVPAARCCPVDAKQCVGTSSADQEVFDILAEPPAV